MPRLQDVRAQGRAVDDGHEPELRHRGRAAASETRHWDGNVRRGESALAAAIKGYSGQMDSVRIVNLFHIVRLRLGCNVWFYYVPSESNISDWPSRGRLRDVLRNREIGAREVRMQLPALRLLTGPWRDGRETSSTTLAEC